MTHPTAASPRLRMRGVRFGYRPERPVLDRLDLTVGPGLTLLTSENGCGKSTLLRLAAGVERPQEGSIEVDGLDLERNEVEARRRLAYLPEHPDVTPYATLREVIGLVCRLREAPAGRAGEVLAEVGLRGMERRSIRELSHGQRRRVLLGAAWVGSPSILLLDEPLEAMDTAMRARILAWVERTVAAGGLVLATTHDPSHWSAIPATLRVLRDGVVR